MRLATWLLLAAALLVGGFEAGQWLRPERAAATPSVCPYSGGGPPFAFQSFEADRMRTLYLDAQTLASANQLFPDDPEFALLPLETGSARVEDATAQIPPEILHAISWVESKINQTRIDVAYGTLGPTLLSFDCGYGIMQVTSSIHNDGGLPSRYEALVGTHFAYNVAAGARILAEKWNDDEIYPFIGESDPTYIESWYYALWAYNGWAISNHPSGPDVDPFRQPYACDDARNGYPYQELVLGCIINPPIVDGVRLWEPLAVTLPSLDDLAAPGGPLELDRYYEGLERWYAGLGGPPFAAMGFELPFSAAPVTLQNGERSDSFADLQKRVLGRPELLFETTEIDLGSTLRAGGAVVEIANVGGGLLPWRVVELPGWLNVDLHAGAALGASYEVIPSSARLRLEAAAGGAPPGVHRSQLRLEFSYPDGSVELRSVTISLEKQGAAFYQAGSPQS